MPGLHDGLVHGIREGRVLRRTLGEGERLMSAETHAALEAAIEAHIHSECDGDMAGAGVLVSETTTLDDLDNDDSVFYWAARNGQSAFLTDGLLNAVLNRSRYTRYDDEGD